MKHLGGLAAASVSADDGNVPIIQGVQQALPDLPHRQPRSLLHPPAFRSVSDRRPKLEESCLSLWQEPMLDMTDSMLTKLLSSTGV